MKRFLTKLTFSLLLVVAGTAFLTAQKVVSGTVTDPSNGDALIGASVLVKGTQTGTITDIDGTYSLKASAGDVLVFSYTGYDDQEVAVGASNTINVSLVAGKLLDEVVVVGYGTQKEKEISSAVVRVTREDFNRGPITDAAQLLQGKVAGLQVYNRGGDPNRASTIRIRGLSTVGANVEPLVVVDGIIGASLSNLDPNDIETFDVLKDGSAAAIYGSRGSSGVIIVTTKKGSRNKDLTLTYNGQLGTSNRSRTLDIMTPSEFAAAGGSNLGFQTDWINEVTQTGITSVHGLSAEGGTEKTTYRASVNARNVDGILQSSGFDQFNTRFNLNTKRLNDKLTIDFNTSFTTKNQNFSFNEALRYAVIGNPTAPVNGADLTKYEFDEAQFGGYFEALGLFDFFNPVSIIKQNKNTGRRSEFNFGANVGYQIIDGLTANFRVANQRNGSNNRQYYSPTSLFRGNATSPIRKGRANFYNDKSDFKLLESYLTYAKSFGSAALTLTGGHSWQQSNFESSFFQVGDFPNNSIDWSNQIEASQDYANAGFISANSDASPDERIIAQFGRASLTLDDTWFVNASVRREGSSKLGPNNQWGIFPAVGVAVDLNKYLNLANVNLLKARVGYGVTGSLPRENGLAQEGRSLVNNPDGSTNTRIFRLANPDLKWEAKAETNFGIDFNTGRLSASLDIYNRVISDFILNVKVEPIGGVDRQTRNAGQLSTNGIELALDYDLIQKDNFTYNTGIVFSTYKSKLDKYVFPKEVRGNLGAPGQNGTNMILVQEGQEIGNIWGPVFDGVDDKGAPKFKDLNGDGKFVVGADKALDSLADMQVLGNGIPDFELGWKNSLTFGKWNVNAFFRGAFGHSLVNTFRAFYEPRISTQTAYNFINTSKAVDGLTAARFSSLYVEKADFVRLDNLTISRSIGNVGQLKNFNVSLTGQNLFTITGYTGADPEPALAYYGAVDNGAVEDFNNPDVLAPGIDSRNNYFVARAVTLGINFNF